jgi:hypothetical protein
LLEGLKPVPILDRLPDERCVINADRGLEALFINSSRGAAAFRPIVENVPPRSACSFGLVLARYQRAMPIVADPELVAA